jgi:hypothetical protein
VIQLLAITLRRAQRAAAAIEKVDAAREHDPLSTYGHLLNAAS